MSIESQLQESVNHCQNPGSIIHSCNNRMYLMTQRHKEMPGGWQLSYICRLRKGINAPVGGTCADPRPRISDRKAAKAVKACLIADLSGIATVKHALQRAESVCGGSDVANQRETLEQRRRTILRRYERSRDAWADGDEPLAWLEAERERRDGALAEVDAALDALPEMPSREAYEQAGSALSEIAAVIEHAADDDLRAAIVRLGVAVVSGEGVSIRYAPEYRWFVGEPHVYGLS